MGRILALIMLLCFGSAALADQQFVCAGGGQERIISVVYLSDGPLPCEVRYDKGDGAEVLWSAQNTEGYCESKAKEFVNKQEGWGYDCTLYQRPSE
jgi:hypothetical protein